jgi:hypothetical protein
LTWGAQRYGYVQRLPARVEVSMLRKLIMSIVVVAIGAGLSVPSVSADATSTCPDGMAPFTTILLPDGAKKDRNNNFIVCGKVGTDGKFHGGPDDMQDDIIL